MLKIMVKDGIDYGFMLNPHTLNTALKLKIKKSKGGKD